MSAIDARDGRETAATADVDPVYRMGDQLFVEPDARLEECFGVDELIRMTRQEIAVARSHIEAWKVIAAGEHAHVLVLEDDVWFARGAAAMIDGGWRAAFATKRTGRPRLLYLSYKDAGGTAERVEACDALFRPVRGLWYLSGYVLCREGASALLRAMPVIGPVDLWINRRFAEMNVLALTAPAILQREDGGSDNSYSILPYLARAGIVDAGSALMRPPSAAVGPVFAWTALGDNDVLPMALSMLGLRVRSFYGDEKPIDVRAVSSGIEPFDAFVNAPLDPSSLAAVVALPGAKFLLAPERDQTAGLPSTRTFILDEDTSDGDPWRSLCSFLGVSPPDGCYPRGVPRAWRMFQDARPTVTPIQSQQSLSKFFSLDDSPWVLPFTEGWTPHEATSLPIVIGDTSLVQAPLDAPSPAFVTLVETFPGNLASFDRGGLVHGPNGAKLVLRASPGGVRPYRSGSFASVRTFGHGRFGVEIKAATGAGLVTGFFLHRDAPRQEIDVELIGREPRRMLVNVYFNPGDEGSAMGYGYRGSPCWIDLGFDATLDFHLYAIEWSPERIRWLVDGRTVHERVSWDPTPIPHLPMRLYANLWAPRSEELAGRVDDAALPAGAAFRNVTVCES